MITDKRGRLVAMAGVLAAIGLSVAGCGQVALKTGDTAASFSLPGLAHRDQQISLSAYAGKPVIVNFFASWSPPCVAETQLLAHFYRYNHGRILVIGVDGRDDRNAALGLLAKSLVSYPVAADPSLAVASTYGVPGFPTTYFLDARHQIVRVDYGWLNWKKLRQGVAHMDAGTFSY
jgi:peroxiredoxin